MILVVVVFLSLLLSAGSSASLCDTACDGLSQLAIPSMRWKHWSRARQLLLSGKLQSHLNSPNFWIAPWFWLSGMEKFTKKGLTSLGVVCVSVLL